MALTPGVPAGTYFEWDPAANENAVVVFRIREVREPRTIPPNDNTVEPTLIDAVILTGSQAKTVVRGEEVIGAGFKGLRRYAPGSDVVAVMSFKPNKYGGKPYIAADAQPQDSDAFALAASVFEKTGGDPYTAAERAANPTGTLTAAAPATPPPAPVQPAAPSPDQAPWGAPAEPAGQPVGGPSGNPLASAAAW